MRERKTIDRNAMRAKHFLKRSTEANSLCGRLVCLYDCFVCLNGPFSACDVAASIAQMDVPSFRALLDNCIADGDSDPKVHASGYDLAAICNALEERLQTILSSASN